MKLMTEMASNPLELPLRWPQGDRHDMQHDAAAAHALKQALDSWNHPQSEWPKAKADELMHAWGFEPEAGK